MTAVVTLAEPISPPEADAAGVREPPGPYPVRFWWLKRLTLLVVLATAGVVVLRMWWGREADRRLRRAVDPIVAQGWPVRAEQMNPAQLPDGVNAALYFKQAIAAIDPNNDSPAASSLNYPAYPPYGAPWETMAEKSVAGSAKVFPLVRRARAFGRFDWGTRMRRPAPATLLPHLNGARHLANTVGDAALYAHVNGDDAAALEALRDVRHLSRAAGDEPFVVSHLVSVGIDALALARLQVIAAGLRVAPEDAAGDAATPPAAAPAGGATALLPATKVATTPRPAPRGQVTALIAELLNERDGVASLKKALAGERAMQLDTAEALGDAAPLLRPMFQLDALRMAEHGDALMEAASQPSWPAADAVLLRAAAARPPVPPPVRAAALFAPPAAAAAKREPVDYPRLLSNSLFGATTLGRAIDQHMRLRADRRMTAVSLAAQLYRADNGHWPPSIDAMVPRYLPAVPADPMAADGRPLKYLLVRDGLPGGGDRPLVYSVGRNGVDDTPDLTVLPNSPWSGWHNGRDEYRDLARWVPVAPATTPASPGTPPASQPATAPAAEAP